MSISKRRQSLWNATRREEYDKSAETTKQGFVDRREGQFIAQNLQQSFSTLDEEGRSFLEYLVLIDRRVVIALVKEDLFDSLTECGFLQIPPGVGVLSKRYNQTTYTVPAAIWAAMTNYGREKLFPAVKDLDVREEVLRNRFAHRIDATVRSEDGFIDLPKM